MLWNSGMPGNTPDYWKLTWSCKVLRVFLAIDVAHLYKPSSQSVSRQSLAAWKAQQLFPTDHSYALDYHTCGLFHSYSVSGNATGHNVAKSYVAPAMLNANSTALLYWRGAGCGVWNMRIYSAFHLPFMCEGEGSQGRQKLILPELAALPSWPDCSQSIQVQVPDCTWFELALRSKRRHQHHYTEKQL